MDNYFSFYGLPVTFGFDAAALKRLFYENSRRYHPDFFTLESESRQAEALEMATMNTNAYRTLSDPDRRMHYILQLFQMIEEAGKTQLPQDFLMEMMDINEALMDLEMEPDALRSAQLLSDIKALEQKMDAEIEPSLSLFDQTQDPKYLMPVKDYFLKKRYLLRILENIATFVPAKDEQDRV